MIAPEQADALMSSLGRIEETLRALRKRLASPYKGILWDRSLLPVARRRPIDGLLDDMLGEIRQLAASLSLERRPQDMTETIQDETRAIQAELEELTRPFHPAGTPVADSSAVRGREHLERLIELADQVLRACADEP